MILFKTLYYGIGLVLALIELGQLKTLGKLSDKMRDFSDLSRIKKNLGEDVKWEDVPSDVRPVVMNKVILSIIEICWLVLGLFTFNWGFFASYMIYVWITGTFQSGQNPSVTFYAFRTVTFVSFVLFVLINSYHLKIDFFSLF